jgi:hypothetical protein
VSVEEKKGFTLTVLASGSNLTYLWKKNGEAITGATAASYAVASAAKSDEGAYVCDVTGGCGAITTAVAQVVVTPTTSVYDDVPVTGALASIIGPQPAAASVYIKVNLGATSDVVLSVLDLQGRRVAQTLAGSLVAGVHILPVDLAACASGVHRLEISAGAQRITLPITVAR